MNSNLASHGSNCSDNDILFANFNQDCSSILVGFKCGFRVYQLTSVDNLDLIYDENETKDVSLVERLFSSSLVAVVSMCAPRKMGAWHFRKRSEICNYSYSNTILAVKMNRLRIVVILEETILIHNISNMKVIHTIRDTPSNPKGLCCLSTNNDRALMAYPGSSVTGEVQLFDVTTLKAVNSINAHNTALAAIAFNESASLIATASGKGTVIRVFSVPDGQKLLEFRRGVKRCVSISSLCFSPDSAFLCASSNTETVHIFKLEQSAPQAHAAAEEGSWIGYFNKVLSNSASYLPTQVSEVLNQGRDFATVKLPFSGMRNVCSIVVLQKLPRVLVISGDGYLYIYNLDPVDGGECTLVRQHSLNRMSIQDDSVTAVPSSSSADGESPPHYHSSSPSGDSANPQTLIPDNKVVSLGETTND